MSETKKKKLKKNNKGLGISINVISFLSFIVFAIVLAGALYLSQQNSFSVLAKQYQVVADNEIKNTVLKFTLEVKQYSLLLSGLAKDPALIELFSTKNLQALQQRADELKAIFPSTLRVRLLLPTTSQPNDLLEPAFTYACLDLLKQSRQQSSTVKVEMHELKGKQQHIDMMQAVSLRGNVVGFIQFAMEPSLLDRWIKNIANDAYVEVHQKTDDGENYLISKLKAGNKQGANSIFDVPGTHWQIEIWKSYKSNESGFSIELLIILAVAILVAGIMVFIFRHLLHKKLIDDLEKYVALITETLTGIKKHQYDFSLTEFKSAASQVENIKLDQKNFEREHDVNSGNGSETKKDDLPDIDPMFMAKDSIQIEELDDASAIDDLDDTSVVENEDNDVSQIEELDDTSAVEPEEQGAKDVEIPADSSVAENINEPRVLEELEFKVTPKADKDNE